MLDRPALPPNSAPVTPTGHPVHNAEPDALRASGHQPEPVLKAIRRKCLDCSGGSPAEVADCLARQCALFPFRFGKNPWRPPPSEAQRQTARNNLATLANPQKIGRFGTKNGAAG
jgi:hypothetical protein